MIRFHQIQIRTGLASFTLISISLLVQQASTSQAAGYRFVNIADTTDAAPTGLFSEFGLAPAISGNTVAFRGVYGNTQGIFTGNGLTLKTIATSIDPTPLGPMGALSEPVISGENVAFIASQQQVIRSNGTTLTTIATADGYGPGDLDSFDHLGVSISGTTVAFRAVATQSGIFTGNGESITRIAGDGDPSPAGPLGAFGPTAIDGEIVLVDSGSKLLTHNGTSLTVIAKSGDPAPKGTFNEIFTGSLSGAKVAFGAAYDTIHRGIFKGDGGALTTIAKSGDASTIGTLLRFGSPSIVGDSVAFSATGDERGIFIGSGGALTPVIQGGSQLFGSVVSEAFFGRFGLDPTGTGNLCFRYSLHDGRHGIAVAVPIPSAADFNGDAYVDGADFLTWQRQFGAGLDDSELSLWKEQFGSPPPSASPIPEPSASHLLIGLLAVSAATIKIGSSRTRNYTREL